MLNITDPNVKRFMDNMHNGIERRSKHLSSSYDEYVLENRIIKVFCENPKLAPPRCADVINARYDRNLSGDRIIQILSTFRLNEKEKRAEVFDWAAKSVDALAKALSTREPKDFDDFKVLREKKLFNHDRHRIQERTVCIMLYYKHPELIIGTDDEAMERFGDVYMKYLFLDMVDVLRKICGKSKGGSRGDKKDGKSERIATLENQLNRSDMLLKDLQDEFDARIQESHQDDLIAFFSQLNSEKYGCILDAIFSAKIGVRQLRRNNVQLPPEISGLFILIDKFAQFIRDNEINPILKPGVVQDMSFDEAEACEYEGTPFKTADDVKRVKVISPGWFYKNKDVQISRPRLKEVVGE